MATDRASGTPTPIAFAYFDRDSCSWKTCQGSLLEASGESCTTWPKRGMWDAGFAYELPTSARRTAASESSSSLDGPMLPTPVAGDALGARNATANRRPDSTGHPGETLLDALWLLHRPDLAELGRLLPTPAARDGENASEQGFRHYAGQGDNPTLLGAARRTTDTLRHSTGASTGPPSDGGSSSSAAPHPDQQTLEDG